ncbi:hypothetical protein TREMEDRAFT_65637 [Tremella mesenterica DSM 1558]|uniref:uncharacterized protein n=1 Tax=Tremella mesenterica (strain ATCC 24925 / CBS 8224 / DSM 1558 / NBRC 9311 / NRRL Y-6157 / RJB 2259-6 / UBC 559-6) TaxID=578456 RepID=UPI00032D101F|nr:uncharacterized protein TREMEDRAFT_65637 [Tremella mesenterica DSM 1558]EIW66360.1 hypothetical protein TREMEDRAFT_65637 [Tremella mesenterica DSM 1558]
MHTDLDAAAEDASSRHTISGIPENLSTYDYDINNTDLQIRRKNFEQSTWRLAVSNVWGEPSIEVVGQPPESTKEEAEMVALTIKTFLAEHRAEIAKDPNEFRIGIATAIEKTHTSLGLQPGAIAMVTDFEHDDFMKSDALTLPQKTSEQEQPPAGIDYNIEHWSGLEFRVSSFMKYPWRIVVSGAWSKDPRAKVVGFPDGTSAIQQDGVATTMSSALAKYSEEIAETPSYFRAAMTIAKGVTEKQWGLDFGVIGAVTNFEHEDYMNWLTKGTGGARSVETYVGAQIKSKAMATLILQPLQAAMDNYMQPDSTTQTRQLAARYRMIEDMKLNAEALGVTDTIRALLGRHPQADDICSLLKKHKRAVTEGSATHDSVTADTKQVSEGIKALFRAQKPSTSADEALLARPDTQENLTQLARLITEQIAGTVPPDSNPTGAWTTLERLITVAVSFVPIQPVPLTKRTLVYGIVHGINTSTPVVVGHTHKGNSREQAENIARAAETHLRTKSEKWLAQQDGQQSLRSLLSQAVETVTSQFRLPSDAVVLGTSDQLLALDGYYGLARDYI